MGEEKEKQTKQQNRHRNLTFLFFRQEKLVNLWFLFSFLIFLF